MSSTQDELFRVLNGNRGVLVSTLRDLVEIDTHVPPGLNYDVFCETLADKLALLGLESTIHEATEKYLTLSGARCLVPKFIHI